MIDRIPSGIFIWHFDDHPGVLKITKLYLEGNGYIVTSISDPAVSEERLGIGLAEEKIDLLILDGSIDYHDSAGEINRNIPPMTGVILARAARTRKPQIPILLYSSEPKYHESNPGLFDEFLQKPALKDALYGAIDRAWINARRRSLS